MEAAFDATGVETTIRNTDNSNHATEIIASNDGSVLGRYLHTIGVPRGDKSRTDELPHMLDAVPEAVRYEYAQITVLHRGVDYDNKMTTRIMTKRPKQYHSELAALIRNVTNEQVTVDSRGVIVSAAAVRALEIDEYSNKL